MDIATAPGMSVPEALLVEGDPGRRGQLASALTRHGYDLDVCDTLDEGRAHFRRQPLIVTHANGDTVELRTFVDFVRREAGDEQPYILAVGCGESPAGVTAAQLGLNDFLSAPVDPQKLGSRLSAISHWLAGRGYQVSDSIDDASRLPDESHVEIEDAGEVECSGCDSNGESLVAIADRLEDLESGKALDLPQGSDEMGGWETNGAASHRAVAVPWEGLFGGSSSAVAVFDSEMRFLYANESYCREYDLADAGLGGRLFEEVFQGFHGKWRQMFDRAQAGEVVRIDEDVIARVDGSTVVVTREIRPWRDSAGSIAGVIFTQEDITVRVREHRRGVFGSNLARSLFENHEVPIMLVQLDGRVLRSNPAARGLLGLQPTASGQISFWEIFPEAGDVASERESFLRSASRVAECGEFDFKPRGISIPGAPPGRLEWIASPHRNSSGGVDAVLFIGSVVPVPPAEAPVAGDLAQRVADNAPSGLVLLDRTGDILFSSQSLHDLLGFGVDDAGSFEGWLSRGVAPSADRDSVLREWRENVWRRQATRVVSLVTVDGWLKEIELRPRLMRDGSLLVALSDVTEARRADDALRASEAKFRTLFVDSPAGVALVDRAGTIVDANPAFERLAGASRFELRRLTMESFFDPADLEAHREAIDGMACGESPPVALAIDLLGRDGRRSAIALSAGAIRNPAGEPFLTSYFAVPTSGQSSPASLDGPPAVAPAVAPAPAPAGPTESAADSSGWREAAFNGLRASVVITDRRGRITDANDAALAMCGYSRGDLIGLGIYRLFMPADPVTFSRMISDQLNRTRRWEAETSVTRADGAQIPCSVELFPAEGGGAAALVCVLRPPGMRAVGSSHAGAPPSGELPRAVRHALRNHLQLVGSLLHLQQRKVTDPAARAHLLECEQRVRAVAVVEEEILRGANPQALDLSRILVHLGETLRDGAGPPIEVRFHELRIETNLALLLALATNELLAVIMARRPPGITVDLTFDGSCGMLAVESPATAGPDDDNDQRLDIARLLVEQTGGRLAVSGEGESRFELHFHRPDFPAE